MVELISLVDINPINVEQPKMETRDGFEVPVIDSQLLQIEDQVCIS